MRLLGNNILRKFGYEIRKTEHKAAYSKLAPACANCFSLFDQEWSSKIPGIEGLGNAGLFEDSRIAWLIENFKNGVKDLDVLELGPLEGGHTYMLEKAGAKVTAIEANHHAFLKCLLVKNFFDLKSRFVLGDFSKSFGEDRRYDLIVGSGVLYHMTDPIALLKNMARATDNLFLWTHYFDPDPQNWNASIRNKIGTKWRTDQTRRIHEEGCCLRLVPQMYNESLEWAGFCGGPETFSSWIYRDDLVNFIRHLGLTDIQTSFDEPAHPNGPSFCLLAQR
jgi:hypothetical protein